MMSHLSALAIVLCIPLCEALVPDFPVATPINDPLFADQGWSPRPTAPPKVPRDFFFRRDFLSNSASYVLIAPDSICGYVSGLPGAPFQCGSSTSCVFFPATGSSAYGAVGCCSTDILNCGFRTACVDSKAFYGSGCNGGCQLDANTMKCSDSSAPYCGSIRYAVPGATVDQYFCSSESASTWQIAFTTFSVSGQSAPARSYKSVARAALASSTSSISSSSSSSSSTSTSASSTTSSSSTTSGTAAPTQSSSDNKSSSNTGAIVGGLIGAAAVLGLIGAGAFFLYKRQYGRRDNNPGISPSHTPLNNLDPAKMGGAWPQEGVYSPQLQPQPYISSYQTQYQPVPVEMPSDFVPRQEFAAHGKSATTPTTAPISNPIDYQYMSPASAHNNLPSTISEADSHSPNLQ